MHPELTSPDGTMSYRPLSVADTIILLDSTGSVLALDHEVRPANRAGEFRLLPGELES